MRIRLDHLDARKVGLFVVDVSAEIALLARIASVPAVQIRMHGDRSDIDHLSAYEACFSMLAHSDERLEQDNYPAHLRAKTFYSGGLCTRRDRVRTRAEARQVLGLGPERAIVVTVAGAAAATHPTRHSRRVRCSEADAEIALPRGSRDILHNLREFGWVP